MKVIEFVWPKLSPLPASRTMLILMLLKRCLISMYNVGFRTYMAASINCQLVQELPLDHILINYQYLASVLRSKTLASYTRLISSMYQTSTTKIVNLVYDRGHFSSTRSFLTKARGRRELNADLHRHRVPRIQAPDTVALVSPMNAMRATNMETMHMNVALCKPTPRGGMIPGREL